MTDCPSPGRTHGAENASWAVLWRRFAEFYRWARALGYGRRAAVVVAALAMKGIPPPGYGG